MTKEVGQLLDEYSAHMQRMLSAERPDHIDRLCNALDSCFQNRKQVFICGNGGSAGNANHIANDLLYLAGVDGGGLQVEALTTNASVMTCLGNDLGYEKIFSKQLEVKGRAGDLLLALSGSGNSKNVVEALKTANQQEMKTLGLIFRQRFER